MGLEEADKTSVEGTWGDKHEFLPPLHQATVLIDVAWSTKLARIPQT